MRENTWADSWNEVGYIPDGSIDMDIAPFVKIRGSLMNGATVISDNPNYNGTLDMLSVKKGDAFVVSEDQGSWWSSTLPKAGDTVISIGNNASLAESWLVLCGVDARATMSALESRLTAIEQQLKTQLNGIIFDVGSNGNLTYETQSHKTL